MLNPLRTCGVIGLVGAGLVLGGVWPDEPPRTHDQIAGEADLVVKDAGTELKHTHVTAYLAREHAPGTSLLWCATLQLAWDQFTKVGGPLSLDGDPPMAVELSAHPFPAGGIDDGSYVAMIGKGPSVIGRIQEELEKKFKGAASPSVLPSASQITEDDLVAYAYLFKNLAFETPMSKLERGMAFGQQRRGSRAFYRGFGINGDTKEWGKVASQVVVWRYEGPERFVIELKTKGAEDRLIVARLEPGATLRETVDRAMGAMDTDAQQAGLRRGEVMAIPVLNFDITRAYEEVTNIPVTTPGSAVMYIRSAMQNIRFRLDEEGAVLKSDASIVALEAAAPPEESRSFVCDGPFLVVMAKKGAGTPYFAAWVENPELLVKK